MSFNVSYIFQAIDKFSPAARKVEKSARMTRKEIDKLSDDFIKLSAMSLRAGKSLRKTGKDLTTKFTLPVLAAGAAMLKIAGDAEEIQNKFDTVFRGVDGAAESAARLSKEFALADSTAKELLSDTGAQLANGLELPREEALRLSEQVVALSGDVASFNNIKGGAAETSEALRKALLGEREMLKSKFNISLLEKEVQAEMSKVMRKNRGLTEKQAKAIATLNLVTKGSADAIGDFNKTRSSFSNQQKIFVQNLKTVGETFGKLLIPAANKALTAINAFLERLSGASKPTKIIILSIMGLVAVIGPLLFVLGMIATALPFVAAGFMLLLGPVGLIALAVAGLVALWFFFGDSIAAFAKKVWPYLKAFGKGIFDFMTFPIRTVISLLMKIPNLVSGALNKIKGLGRAIKDRIPFMGSDEAPANDNSAAASAVTAQNTVINATAKSKLEGKLDINLNAPEGAVKSVESKTDTDVDLNVGSSTAGGR